MQGLGREWYAEAPVWTWAVDAPVLWYQTKQATEILWKTVFTSCPSMMNMIYFPFRICVKRKQNISGLQLGNMLTFMSEVLVFCKSSVSFSHVTQTRSTYFFLSLGNSTNSGSVTVWDVRQMFSVHILDQRVSKFCATNSTLTSKIHFLQNKTANLSGATPKRQLLSNEASSLNNCLVFHMCVIVCWPQWDNSCACTDMSTGLASLSCDKLSHSEKHWLCCYFLHIESCIQMCSPDPVSHGIQMLHMLNWASVTPWTWEEVPSSHVAILFHFKCHCLVVLNRTYRLSVATCFLSRQNQFQRRFPP